MAGDLPTNGLNQPPPSPGYFRVNTSSDAIGNTQWRQSSLNRSTRIRSTVDVADIIDNPTYGQS